MTVLNPGHPAAKAAGCICAVLDNNHGRVAPHPPDGWYITVGCPIHHAGKSWDHPEPVD